MKINKWCYLWLIILFVLAGCTPHVLYLAPGKYLGPVLEKSSQGHLLLQEFVEDFGEAGLVGEHMIGSKKQIFKIESAKVSGTLDALLRDRFFDRNITFKQEGAWDLSMKGLGDLPMGGGNIVVGGRITRLSVMAKTGLTRLTTRFELAMDIDCMIGVVNEREIIRKSVYITEKVIKVSANQKAIERVLDNFLVSAAQQVILSIEASLTPLVNYQNTPR